ncbi:putative mismatch repair-like protein [Pedobacter sp. BAL39]|uniref:MutS-related protein n=1 Tax=Pedobacter sp. BAL39 TaxID=391596 RepID=UPI00015597AC|nr:putative mismatch repair-like protein [Pedobacter sp. BAL39]EDM38904.1 putative mismatch repair-like protein [Pedobacter sp. BAL39]
MKLFTTDQQTLDDLNIFGKHGSDSVFALFNKTATRGGAALLEAFFRNPMSDEAAISQRSVLIRYFASKAVGFPFDPADFVIIEQYLSNTDERSKLSAQVQSASAKLTSLIAVDAEVASFHKGINAVASLMKKMRTFLNSLEVGIHDYYQKDSVALLSILSHPDFAEVLEHQAEKKFSNTEYATYDVLFRFRNRELIHELLQQVYQLDVYLAIAKTALEHNFSFPLALPGDQQVVQLEGFYHPQLKEAVSNSIEINRDSNVIFLTGANMAGKSTFMKSLSVNMYLAHMGFPVAADGMRFSVLDGIYTTINLPDNLGMGASHFYAEVLRAKKIAAELKTKNLFIVFDELFRGTNVKDAGEATIALTEGFARKRGSIFVISTHIIEAGDVLREKCSNISYVYLPTSMSGNTPVYTYKLKQGITEDRHGIIIINNEGILQALDCGLNVQEKSVGQVVSVSEKPVAFTVDQQTLTDLNLLGKYKSNSVYNSFNKVETLGGERLLQEMFHHPLTDAEQINLRSSLFKYFGSLGFTFPVKKELFVLAEGYLTSGTESNLPSALLGLLSKKLQAEFLKDEQFSFIHDGLLAAIKMLKLYAGFVEKLAAICLTGSPYFEELASQQRIINDKRLGFLHTGQSLEKLSLFEVAKYDFLFKHTLRNEVEVVLNCLYRLDVFFAVSGVGKHRGYAYAHALPPTENIMRLTGLVHPALVRGIPNAVSLTQDENMMFLTGANMAGKSTFMKAFGIAVYLAHMGFPVAAEDMQFSVKDGLYTSINVPDSLTDGHSHFYAEVLRVKKVAEEVGAGKKLVVIFDELFKGTNVKDAYDGTLAVTGAFSKYRSCFYIVSTHIIEVGPALQNSGSQVQFAYLPTVMEGNKPKYTYKLEQGITSDRQGMLIIENEGIFDLLKSK